MRKGLLVVAGLAMAAVAGLAIASGAGIKLPKCSMPMCRDVNCSADVLCVSGAHVKTCADVCNGK